MKTEMTAKRLSSIWPKLNKQDDIGDYIEQVKEHRFDLCQSEITETVCLTCDEWDEFTHGLLSDRSWLAGKGGCPERGVRYCLLVVRPGETSADSVAIFVDPQGYDYARYVGFYITDTQPRTVTNPPDLPDLAAAMETMLCGRSYKDRVLNNIVFDRQAEAVGA